HTGNALGGCDVRKRLAFDDIADGINTGYVGPVKIVYDHAAFFRIDPYLFQAQVFNVWRDAQCRKDRLDINGFRALGGFDLYLAQLAGGIYRLDLGTGEDVYTGLFKAPLQLFGYFFVLHRYNTVEVFYNRDLCADCIVEIRKFNAYGPRTYHYEGFRLFFET